MSDSQTSFGQKIIKFGTWLFLVFIFALIVITFGMPDFIGTSSRIDSYNAAKIGSEYLTKAELGEYQKRLEERMGQNLKGLDEKNRKMFEDIIKSRATDEAIDSKLFAQLLSQAGYVPASSSEAKLLASYYKKQFGEFIIDGRLDMERLNEFLGQRRLTLDQISRAMLREYGPQRAREMLQAVNYASDFQVLDEARFNATRASYRIVVIDQAIKEKNVRARFNPSEADIQGKFKTEFLSKDAKAILDNSKRESIRATLMNERRATLEKDFLQALTQASKQGLDQVAALAGAKIVAVDDAGLSNDLDSKKSKDAGAVSLAALSQSDIFVRQRLAVVEGQTVGPVEAGGSVYYFSVNARKTSDLPRAAAYAQIAKVQDELGKSKTISKDNTFEKNFEASARNTYAQVLTVALEIHRAHVRIIRYNAPKEPTGAAN